MGGGELSTDATNNLYWNSSQVNSQRGFVTLLSNESTVTTSDANITVSSIIMITPYGDITQTGTNNNSFWVSLYEDTGHPINSTWTLNLAVIADPSNSINFAYNILQY
jgi:hypothetical protein